MMSKKGEISFLLLNVSSLSRHLVDVYELLNHVDAPFVVLTGTHHDDKTIKLFSSHYSNFNVFSMRGTNPVGGVLVAVHKSIRASRTRPYDTENLIVLEIGEATESFQLVACYSPPTEPLSLLTFDEILLRSRNTIFMGDFDAKHQSWSTPTVNQKGRALYDWLTARNHSLSFEVVNRCFSTSTRSTATIDFVSSLRRTYCRPFSMSYRLWAVTITQSCGIHHSKCQRHTYGNQSNVYPLLTRRAISDSCFLLLELLVKGNA